jgi:hypothetical protein
VRRHALDLTILLVLATGACAYVSLAVPGDRTIAIHGYVLFVGLLLIIGVLAAVAAAAPPAHRSDLRRALDERSEPPPPVSQLARIEREVTLAIGNAHDLHMRLLPHLYDIAEARLERGGRRPAPETLGPWWELLRPDRPEPPDRFARGIREAELRALVAALEQL